MEIFVYVGLAICAALLSFLLRQVRPELSFLLVLATTLFILLSLLPRMATIFSLVQRLADSASIGQVHMRTLLKIMGVAYVAEYGALICKDVGENTLATKVELAGKLIILSLSVPLVLVILETTLKMIP